MPNYKLPPTATDIEILLKSAAFWPVGTPDSAKVLYAKEEATIGADGAWSEFQLRTGWQPFLPKTLTGLVSKTAASAVLTGTGTLFTDEDEGIEVGDYLMVPGGSKETRIVSEIVSDTELLVSEPFVHSASLAYAYPLETRIYDASDTNGVVRLGAGLVDVPIVSVGGQTYQNERNFWMRRSNAHLTGAPYDEIQFLGSVFGGSVWAQPGRISVTGRWGYTTSVPPAAWMAVLRFGAVQTLSMVENTQSIASLSQDGFSKAWDIVGIITQKDLLNEWPKLFEKYVQMYTRVVV